MDQSPQQHKVFHPKGHAPVSCVRVASRVTGAVRADVYRPLLTEAELAYAARHKAATLLAALRRLEEDG